LSFTLSFVLCLPPFLSLYLFSPGARFVVSSLFFCFPLSSFLSPLFLPPYLHSFPRALPVCLNAAIFCSSRFLLLLVRCIRTFHDHNRILGSMRRSSHYPQCPSAMAEGSPNTQSTSPSHSGHGHATRTRLRSLGPHELLHSHRSPQTPQHKPCPPGKNCSCPPHTPPLRGCDPLGNNVLGIGRP